MIPNEKARLRDRVAELEAELNLRPKKVYRCHTPFRTSAKHGNTYVAIGDEYSEDHPLVKNRERYFDHVDTINPSDKEYV